MVHNGKFCISGGHGYGTDLKSVECFDPESGVWTELTDMPTSLHSQSLISYENKLILVGGINGTSSANTVLELSNLEENGTWKALPSMKDCRFDFSAAVLDNEVFVMGGWNGTAN